MRKNEKKIERAENNKTDFLRAYIMLPSLFQAVVRSLLMKECNWGQAKGTTAKSYCYRNGTVKISKPEADLVENIFKKYGIDA